MRNVNSIFNKKELIEYMVEVNIFYKRHIERKDIYIIREQKQNVRVANNRFNFIFNLGLGFSMMSLSLSQICHMASLSVTN